MRSAIIILGATILHGCADSSSASKSPEPDTSADGRAPARELTRIPGTAFALAPPPGFVLADEFSGFADMQTGSSLMVEAIPGPFAQVGRGFSDPKTLETQAMVVIERQDLRHGDMDGMLLRVDQRVQGVKAQKWIWMFGDGQASAFVMGTCVQSDCKEQLEVLKKAMLTVAWDRSADPDAEEALGYTLAEMADLQVGGRMQKMLTLTPDGRAQIDEASPILFIIGPALGSGHLADREAFARQRFTQLPLENITLEMLEPATIDGMDGFALVGTGTTSFGADVFVFSAIVFEENNYWIAMGYAPRSAREEWLPKFRRVAEGLRRDAG